MRLFSFSLILADKNQSAYNKSGAAAAFVETEGRRWISSGTLGPPSAIFVSRKHKESFGAEAITLVDGWEYERVVLRS
jgi:hypothetical protein